MKLIATKGFLFQECSFICKDNEKLLSKKWNFIALEAIRIAPHVIHKSH